MFFFGIGHPIDHSNTIQERNHGQCVWQYGVDFRGSDLVLHDNMDHNGKQAIEHYHVLTRAFYFFSTIR